MSSNESLAERYTAGRMTAKEEQAFEALMLENRDVAAEVDTLHRMRAGFRRLRRTCALIKELHPLCHQSSG